MGLKVLNANADFRISQPSPRYMWLNSHLSTSSIMSKSKGFPRFSGFAINNQLSTLNFCNGNLTPSYSREPFSLFILLFSFLIPEG
jgi:hypothetical protein